MANSAPTPYPVLDRLLADARATDDQDLIDGVIGAENARRTFEAEYALKVIALQERAEAAHTFMAAACAEIGLMLGISSRAAEHLIGSYEMIAARPLVWQAWHDARLDRTKADRIVDLLAHIDDPLREQLEAQAIEYGACHTAAQLRTKLIAMTCDTDPDEKQRKEALDRRGVGIELAGHGMAHIWAYVSVEVGETFLKSLTQLANTPDCPDPYQQGQDRTVEQRRADALGGFLDEVCDYSIDVQVTIPADMLMGVETSGANLNGSPITHKLALALAWSPDSRWTRLVTDPLTGTLLDAGKQKYEIDHDLRTAVRLRDQTCRFPGCHRPAEYTDTDHVIPYRLHEWTWPEGLVCLCRYHHRVKTFGRWQLHTTSTHAQQLTWTSPLGRTYTTRPPNRRRD